MLYLQFIVGGERYVISTRPIVEILPFARLRPFPHAPIYVAGLLNYRGKSVPVIDICLLMHDRPASAVLSTRIILVNYPLDNLTTVHLGMLIEGVTETLALDESKFTPAGIHLESDAYLGDVITDHEGILQRINFLSVVPAEAHQILFTNSREE